MTICQHILVILHTVPSFFWHAIPSLPNHATVFSCCCHVFEKKGIVIKLPFCAKESGKKKKKVIVLTRIGLTNMPLATNGLIKSSTSSRKDRIWRRRWFPQAIWSFYQRPCNATDEDGEVNKSDEFDGKYYFIESFCFSGVSGSCVFSLASCFWWYLSQFFPLSFL